jgi:integrase
MSPYLSPFACMADNIDEFERWERYAGHSPATRRRRKGTLRRFRRENPVWPADRKGEKRVIERWLGQFESPQTRRSYLGDLRAFFRWGVEHDAVPHDPTVGVRTAKVPHRTPTPLTDQQVRDCFDACRSSQDRLAIGLGVYGGLRVSEMAHLEYRDVDLVGRVLTVRQGKGGKDRSIPIHDRLAVIIRECGHTMTANVGDTVSTRIKAVFSHAGVTGHRPHDLRATFATGALRAGNDLIQVKHWLGHASVATTERYILPDMDDLDGINRLSFAA